MKSMKHEQEHLITKEIINANGQGNIQGDQHTTLKQTQATPCTNTKESKETSYEKQHDKGEKATWKVKDKVSIKRNTMLQRKENEEKQPNDNSKKRAGKFVNLAPTNHDNNPCCNNLHISQNEDEKGQPSMQEAANEVYGQTTEKITQWSQSMIPKIPPPIKISSNFDIYRPRKQRTNQNNPK
ncbi:hypothetical protein RDI58_000936 [Solanum bulbocastanum]|uniref:Uncharacterized protein n=1 Tax=Solanum bulbocastanum TaxID=147425 RepID=A0AAN8U209_SOLBU